MPMRFRMTAAQPGRLAHLSGIIDTSIRSRLSKNRETAKPDYPQPLQLNLNAGPGHRRRRQRGNPRGNLCYVVPGSTDMRGHL